MSNSRTITNPLSTVWCLVSIALSLSVPTVTAVPPAAAQTYKVLHAFTGVPDGIQPYGGVTINKKGTIFGTTVYGGTATNNCNNSYGCGTVYRLVKNGKDKILYDFVMGADGGEPDSALLLGGSGELYGTTGDGYWVPSSPYGTIYKIDDAGQETVLYTFSGGADGRYPYAGLAQDSSGNLYGTTYQGGTGSCTDGTNVVGCGLVFKLDKRGTLTVLHSFAGDKDGAFPYGGVILDSQGNLYGSTSDWCFGANCIGASGYSGSVFRLGKTGKMTVLYNFKGGTDGGWPVAGVVRDADGNLYGTAIFGGTGSCTVGFGGCGTVWKVNKTGKETVLHNFTGGKDSKFPESTLNRDAAGNLYGTTWGYYYNNDWGSVFKISSKGGKMTELHTFKGPDGGAPGGGAALLLDAKGNIYGTTTIGGDNCNPAYFNGGCGVVFQIAPR